MGFALFVLVDTIYYNLTAFPSTKENSKIIKMVTYVVFIWKYKFSKGALSVYD